MTRRDKLNLVLGVIAFAAMSVYSSRNLKVSTDISDFLPASDDHRMAEISTKLAESSLTRTMILSVEGPDSEAALAGGRELGEALRTNPEVLRCTVGPSEGFVEGVYNLLFPHRYDLYSDEPERDWAARLSPVGLTADAEELKRQLGLPMGLMVKRIAGADPLLAFPKLMKQLEAANAGSLKVVDNQFLSADGLHAIVFIEMKHSPFDGAAQAPFLDAIERQFARINGAHGGILKLEQSGVNRYAHDSERAVKKDIQRISSLSTIAVTVMFLLLFRSVRVLLLSFIPIFYGLAAAVAACAFFFGQIHGLTLAFGSCLIGVCVDYPVHFLNRHSLQPAPDGPRGTMNRIFGAVVLGALTTIAGFVGLAWTSFPGMRELAVFAIVGVFAALVSTIWFLPPLSERSPRPVKLNKAFADAVGGVLGGLSRNRNRLLVLPAGALLACVIGLPRVRWSDDLNALNRINEATQAEDQRVLARVSPMDGGRFIIVTAPDDARALALNDQVNAALLLAKKAGELDAFSSLHSLVYSPELQRRNEAALRADPTLAGRVTTAFSAAGFRPEAFAAFADTLAQPAPAPLQMSEVLQSPLGELARPFRVELGKEVGVVTLMRGVTKLAALQARISQIPGAHLFDQTEFLAQAYGHYRERTLELMLVGIVVMFLMIFAMYRRIRPTIAGGLPACLASAATLGTLGLLGVTCNLLHVVALIIVLSTGEDYAVFLLSSARDPEALQASGVSIVLCAASAVLGFGLLGLSAMPALQALGVTTSIGMAFSLLLAPMALLIAPAGSDS